MASEYEDSPRGSAAPPVWRALDSKDFSEEEYKRELGFHHIKVPKGESAAAIYRQQGRAVSEKPRSGVFRDFKMYGVHPSRVAVQFARITIPFLVSSLSALQVASEITNQKARTQEKKPETKWSEEEEAALAISVMTPTASHIRTPPLMDSAFELINVLKERKFFNPYAPGLQKVMSALNLYLFRFGNFDLPPEYLVPSRERVLMELLPLVNRDTVMTEMKTRILVDPDRWSDSNPQDASPVDTASLLMDLMTTEATSSQMRLVVDWYRMAHRRRQTYELVERILQNSDLMVATVEIRNSLHR